MFFLPVNHAKRVAKSLSAELKKWSFKRSYTVVLELVAEMYGYQNWLHLTREAETGIATVWDEEAESEVVRLRVGRQVDVLLNAGVPGSVARQIIEAVRPTERSLGAKPSSGKTADDLKSADAWYNEAVEAFSEKEYETAHNLTIDVLHSKRPNTEKVRFFELLTELIPHYPIAKANVALAMVYGDGTNKDVISGRAVLLEAVDYPALPANIKETVLNVLGDIARGAHGGGPLSREMSLGYYERSARETGSATGSFNAGELLLQGGKIESAAEMYRISALAGHPNGMLKLAIMMIEGDIEGDADEMERLIRASAALGHPLAKKTLHDIPMLRGGVEFANRMTNLMMAPSKSGRR
jgi:TPR repeat protein